MSKCICDKCKEEIELSEIILEYIPKYKITVKGIKCSNCDTTFITNVLDNNLIDNINKAYELQSELVNINNEMDSKYRFYKNNNINIPDTLKFKYMNLLTDMYNKYKKQVNANYIRGIKLKEMYIKGDFND